MLLHRLAERAEDDPVLPELVLHRGADAHRVEDRVHRHAREKLLLGERDPQLLVGAQQLGSTSSSDCSGFTDRGAE
jgi:hypothetical protein